MSGVSYDLKVAWLRRFKGAAALLILLFCFPGKYLYAKPAANGGVSLVYSANDDLCDKTVESLNEIRKKMPAATYLSQARSIFFQSGKFSPPAWIDHPDPELGLAFDEFDGNPAPELDGFRQDGLGYWFGQAFFRADVFSEGRQNLILVSHDVLGHHGDYATHLVIFKSGMPYRIMVPESGAAGGGEQIAPDVIAMTIDVTGRIPADFPPVPAPSRVAKKLKVLMTGKGSQLPPQEPFLYMSKLFFLAGTPLVDSGLVYEITSQRDISVVCLTTRKSLKGYLKIN